MPRQARTVIPALPHHVVQRGNRRQPTFFRPADYASYLTIAGDQFRAAGVEVLAYCLMPNHVHLIATPRDEMGLAIAVGRTHLKYTRYINARETWTGCLWQGRFQSSPMDDAYFRRCLRYVGLNPVRAGLVERAADWPWSSVQAHLGVRADRLITPGAVNAVLDEEGDGFFEVDLRGDDLARLRADLREGRPLAEAGQRPRD
ncbi:MAG TPA: transposase [Caulobacter sp.]|nr:transposase [Caulobacter sp.]